MMHALLARHTDDMPVAFGSAGTRSARDLLHDAARVAAALPDARAESQVLLVLRHDRYAVACALLGAMVRGHAVALPPETGRETITRIADDPRTVVIVHDTPSSLGIRLPELLSRTDDVAPITRESLVHSRCHARLFGRGDARALSEVAKPAGQWLDEGAALGSEFNFAPGMRVVSSVAPAQAYGIVLGVLAPLLTGGAFYRDVCAAEALVAHLPALRCHTLVTVPTHLRALAEAAPATTQGIVRVVSSLSPLVDTLAQAFYARHGLPISDLFASALTGAIALRQAPAQPAFRALSGVDVSCHEGLLTVRRDARQTALACRVEAAQAGFVYSGEVEDTIESTDATLPRLFGSTLEAFLRTLPGVTDAAVVVVNSPDEPGQIYAALGSDNAQLADARRALEDTFGARATPRRMLRVKAIKRDSTGRYARDEVLRLFRLRPDGSALNFALSVGEPAAIDPAQPLRRVFRVHIPTDYAYYDGHFTGYPILAGAVQLSELVLPCVRKVRPELRTITHVSRLKFTGRIQPGEEIDVVLTLREQAATLDFVLARGNTQCAAGTLQFAEGGSR